MIDLKGTAVAVALLLGLGTLSILAATIVVPLTQDHVPVMRTHLRIYVAAPPERGIEATERIMHDAADLMQSQLDDRLAELEIMRAKADQLQRAVVFVDCVERRSGKPFTKAFKRGRHNDTCRDYVNGMEGVILQAEADRIVKR